MASTPPIPDLVDRWYELQQHGQTVSLRELCGDSPEKIDDLKRHLQAVSSMMSFLGLEGDGAPHGAETRSLHSGDASAAEAEVPTTRWPGSSPSDPGGMAGSRDLPGYEVLGELGRGGMGVVYKARHLALNRLVALKMILAGVHAGPQQTARFRAEAEAVARLKHPNIVQVYEIGEHHGLPYLSLEFVDGGSLDRRLNGTPLPPRTAAELLEPLARAIHAAHTHGIVHRDLKPGNVLLERAESGPADLGIPKVADFGLAKDLGADVQTATGNVVGTPSYMAPEQAEGRSRDIGPPADVHALGAILYETLTGRPPFKGATLVDTLEQVRTQEPVPPSRLQPKVPRDLETICLKCLRKEPARRYASAAALADDLRRFLDDRPILARPVGRVERLRRWCRRNPVVAGLSAALLVAVLGGLCGMAFLWRQAEGEREQAQTRAAEARAEADHADKFAALLAKMFRASDPLGLDAIPTVRPPKSEVRWAQAILDRGAESITTELNGDPERQARLLDTIGSVYCTLGVTTKAQPLLERALELRRQSLSADHPDLAASLHNLGWLNHQKGDYTKAEDLYRQALEIRRRHAAGDPVALSTTLFCLGWLLTDLEDYAAAESMFAETIALRVGARGEGDRDVAVARVGLAAVYIAEGKFAEAVAPYAQAKAALKREADPAFVESVDLFQSAMMSRELSSSVGGRLGLGGVEQAQRSFEKSLELARRALGDRHPYVGLVHHELAVTLQRQGKDEEAERNYRACLRILREYGLEHPKATVVLRNFGRLLDRRGKRSEAEQLLQEAEEARRTHFGPNHYLLADFLMVHAELLDGPTERSRREPLLREALAIYRHPVGRVPRGRRAVCLYRLADCLDQARAAEAEQLLREALLLARQDHGEQAPLVGWVLCDLAWAVMDQGKHDGVEEWLSEALTILRQPRGPAADLRWTWQCFGRFYLDTGQTVKAADAALERRALAEGDADELYAVACELGRCIAGLDEAAPERGRYAGLAVATLRQAAAKGLKDASRLEKEKALGPLRDRDDFQMLVEQLKAAAKK
jgi:tetratricopeptide (TPR) repeat protein